MGVTLGTIAAARQDGWLDTIVTSYAVAISTV